MIDLDHIIIDLEQIIMKKNKKYKEVMKEEEEEIEEQVEEEIYKTKKDH